MLFVLFTYFSCLVPCSVYPETTLDGRADRHVIAFARNKRRGPSGDCLPPSPRQTLTG